jgi:SAM-dependent methyltransferase
MKKWILKALIQKLISALPMRHRINYLFQKYVTKGVRLSPQYLEDKLIHFSHHFRYFEEIKGGVKEKTVLELGTGWYPIVPVCFFLAGAERIYTVDITPFLTPEKVRQTLAKLIEWRENGQLQNYVQPLPERWDQLVRLSAQTDADLPTLLKALHIDYLVADARKLPLEAASIDFITSNNTFEHIYPHILEPILREFRRVLRPGGLMSHFIDLSDHFAHLDPTITIYNFLRFSRRQWRLIDNPIQPQNRWRMPQYRQLFEQTGWQVLKEENRPGDLEALRSVPVHEEWKSMTEEDLAVSHGYVVTDPSARS